MLNIARWQWCNADNFKIVFDDEIMLIPVCTYNIMLST